jgi:hypothetical protein
MATIKSQLIQRMDEQCAVLRREQLGHASWLVSWQELGPTRWMARLSGPGCEETIEAIGRDRCGAIAAAEAEATRHLTQQAAREARRAARQVS